MQNLCNLQEAGSASAHRKVSTGNTQMAVQERAKELWTVALLLLRSQPNAANAEEYGQALTQLSSAVQAAFYMQLFIMIYDPQLP